MKRIILSMLIGIMTFTDAFALTDSRYKTASECFDALLNSQSNIEFINKGDGDGFQGLQMALSKYATIEDQYYALTTTDDKIKDRYAERVLYSVLATQIVTFVANNCPEQFKVFYGINEQNILVPLVWDEDDKTLKLTTLEGFENTPQEKRKILSLLTCELGKQVKGNFYLLLLPSTGQQLEVGQSITYESAKGLVNNSFSRFSQCKNFWHTKKSSDGEYIDSLNAYLNGSHDAIEPDWYAVDTLHFTNAELSFPGLLVPYNKSDNVYQGVLSNNSLYTHTAKIPTLAEALDKAHQMSSALYNDDCFEPVNIVVLSVSDHKKLGIDFLGGIKEIATSVKRTGESFDYQKVVSSILLHALMETIPYDEIFEIGEFVAGLFWSEKVAAVSSYFDLTEWDFETDQEIPIERLRSGYVIDIIPANRKMIQNKYQITATSKSQHVDASITKGDMKDVKTCVGQC